MSAAIRLLSACCLILVPLANAADLFPGQLLIRTSTMAGTNVASEDREKLSVAISTDGVNWRRLYRKSPLTNFCRDASVTSRNGEYIAVYTAAFNSTNAYFGLARSTNLVNWIASGVSLTGSAISNTPNNTWAPEWFVDNGRYFVLVRSSQRNTNFTYFKDYAPPGIGYLECLDPGTWTNWTDFTPLNELEPTYENDPFLIKVGGTYHLFTDHFNYPGKPAILHRKSTAGPFSGFGPPVNIATNFANAPAYVASGLSPVSPWEGQFVLPLGGNRYRLYFQAMWFDASFCIDSNDSMQTWDINSMQRLTYDGLPADGHGSVISVVNSNLLVPIITSAKLADSSIDSIQAAVSVYNASLLATNRLAGQTDVIGSPATYGLYTPASIVDLNMGGIVLDKVGSQVTLQMQLQSTTNISSPFSNHGPPLLFPVELPGDKYFLRVRALGPQ